MAKARSLYRVGRHPNSLAALARHRAPFAAGQSGNPAGRPAGGPLITPALRRYAQLTVDEFAALDPRQMTVAEAEAYIYHARAMEADGSRERLEVAERLDGRVKDTLELQGDPDAPVILKWADGSIVSRRL